MLNLVIKRYPRDTKWYILNKADGNFQCYKSLDNVDQAIEWVDKHYPEASTEVIDLQKT